MEKWDIMETSPERLKEAKQEKWKTHRRNGGFNGKTIGKP